MRRCFAASFACLVAVPCLADCRSDKPPAGGSGPHDRGLGAPGDPCIAEPGDTNYGCSADKTQELVCDPATSAVKVWNACRGPKGCSLEQGVVTCDPSAARSGEACRPADTHACSEDGGAELQCSPQGAWTTQRACKLAGCKVKSDAVFCE